MIISAQSKWTVNNTEAFYAVYISGDFAYDMDSVSDY